MLTARDIRSAGEEAVIEDIVFMIDMGEWPERVASRTGRNPAALARLLYRHNRPELAREFELFAKRAKRHREWRPR